MTDPTNALTERQLEYIGLVADGNSLQTVAELKFVNYQTVRRELKAACERVEASSYHQLVAISVEHGLIRRNENGNWCPVLVDGVIG